MALRVHRLALLAAIALGCGGDADPRTPVEFWGLGREGEVVAKLVPAFERAHPDLRVRVQQVPWSAAHEKLLTAFVGDSLPDAFQLGTTWIAELAVLGALAPLDDRLAGAVDSDDFFAGIRDATRVAGRVFAVPWYVDTRLWFYRSDLLARAGVPEPPRSLPAWSAAMQRLQATLPPDHHALLLPLTEWEPLVVLALSFGAELLRDGDRYGNFQSDAFREAFALYLGLFERGLARRAGAGGGASATRDFAEGWICATLSGPWTLGEFAERLPESLAAAWSTAPVPGADEGRPGVSIAGGGALAVAADSPRQEAAFRFVAWLADPARQVEFYRLSGDLPPGRRAWNDPALAGDPRAGAFRTQLESARALPAVPEWERIAARISRYTELAVRGELAPDAALAALDADVDRLLAKRRALLERAARPADRKR